MKKLFKITLATTLVLNIVACSSDDGNDKKTTTPMAISSIQKGPEDSLWVSITNNSNPRVMIIDTQHNNDIVDEIETTYNPMEINFIDTAQNKAAIISTVASDYSDSDIELVDLQTGVLNGALISTPANYANGLSDYGISAFDKFFYRIGKYNIDMITQYAIDAPSTLIYNYSTLNSSSDSTSNPYKLIFISNTKAYLIRYNTLTAWIVNPSATTEAAYKLGELDLSAYDDGDGQVEMTDGIIVDGKLYIAMQRLNYWAIIEDNAYVAVFDTATDTEIDTTPLDSTDLNGINLKTNNPNKFAYQENAGLFVQSIGDYAPKYIGGIEKINTIDYTTNIIVDDGDNSTTDAPSHPYGLIADVAIISDTLGYFVSYNGWGDNTLYQFNPTTGASIAKVSL